MSPTFVLLSKSLLTFRRARAAIVITFLVPIALIFLFGHVFGLFRKDPAPEGIKIAVVNESPDATAEKLVNALKAEKAFAVVTQIRGPDGNLRPLTEADARAAIHDNDYRYALILPPDLLSDSRFGVRMKFLSSPRYEMEAQMVNGMLQKTVFSNVPALLGQSLQRQARTFIGQSRLDAFNRGLADTITNTFGGDPAHVQKQIEAGDFFAGALDTTANTAPSSSTTAGDAKERAPTNDVFSRLVKIETEQVEGTKVKNPMAARLVGGYSIMFLLFAVSGGATAMFYEKATGIFQRVLSSPVKPAHIVWARFLFGTLLGIVQISAMFLAGRIFFHLEILPHLGALAVVTVAAAAACSAFGILVAAIAPSAEAANGIATFLVISMSAVGGAWVPVSWMPGYIQAVSKLTLVYWSVEGVTDVLWAGHSLLQVLPKVGILAGIAVGVMAVSIWIFNRNKFFEG